MAKKQAHTLTNSVQTSFKIQSRKTIFIIAIGVFHLDAADPFQCPLQVILSGVHRVHKHTAALIMKEHFIQLHKDAAGLSQNKLPPSPLLRIFLFLGQA